MINKVFVDGREGTTGLKIIERLEGRADVELLLIDSELRRDKVARREFINRSDFTFLCLPDDAARESVSLVENESVKIIDASTAHRLDWTYGFPELTRAAEKRESHYDKIKSSKRVAVPGCYACGFIALSAPLIAAGIIAPDEPLTAFGISGYSGAGKAAIADYESPDRPKSYDSPRLYALGQEHKHLPEMQKYSGLSQPPMFNPIIDNYYSGMLVNIPLRAKSATAILETYERHYQNRPLIKTAKADGFLAANSLSGKDNLEIFVNADPANERVLLTARFDNLGKGASGAAIQCFNIMSGCDETLGLWL